MSAEMDQKTCRWKKFPLPKVFGPMDRKASSRRSIECSINSTVDFKDSPVESPIASSSASSSSFYKKFSENRSLKLSGFSTHTEAFRIFATTWNVAGQIPDSELNLNELLLSDDHSDIYALGFQEVVPLNAGNVLVIEDNEPAARWFALINQALNRRSSPADASAISEASASCSFTQSSAIGPSLLHKNRSPLREVRRGRRLKSCTCPAERRRPTRRPPYRAPPCLMVSCSNNRHGVESDATSDEEEDVIIGDYEASSVAANSDSFMWPDTLADPATAAASRRRYCLVACKQMVGLFVTVWVRTELVPHVGHVRFSCVGRGIVGCLGNKGCISVSMLVHQTSLCLVCSHLASGEKEGDELRRNSDVVEILRNTHFRRLCKTSGRSIPERILDHDRVIWLGDLNYRIALSYSETKKLVEANDWDTLFEKDQLRTERESGVFRGWNEGKIFFAPTYKYASNSDVYAGESAMSKKKRRTPAWCDRILWQGEGMVQESYIRGESRFSDHRPVCAVFTVEVAVLDTKVGANMKVGAEELLPRITT
ncbi:hypothetical protein GUJ93_ZPchr0011g26963 [Zizania palustris]|uniref:Inositol polyphosphate-related phosphatase domain-containing protein n=1 Tax=Zizania palustris TaxID=103762 RepID=A0A8J6BSD6_ZIZPA|nr:hypothetical protein GUJ93_ZPchr0011g26963 [Zizania palustris]KAG8089204.1 hypothetical protein GUJ93_ZPchr0011g26963 [Zizania palustris]